MGGFDCLWILLGWFGLMVGWVSRFLYSALVVALFCYVVDCGLMVGVCCGFSWFGWMCLSLLCVGGVVAWFLFVFCWVLCCFCCFVFAGVCVCLRLVSGNDVLVGGVLVWLLTFDCIDCGVSVVMVDLVYWLVSLRLLWSLFWWVYYSGFLLVLVLMWVLLFWWDTGVVCWLV